MADNDQGEKPTLYILIPAYRDDESLRLLLPRLDQALDHEQIHPYAPRLLIVDDGSPEPMLEGLNEPLSNLASVEMLSLRRNLGHQRAIAVGLSWLDAHREFKRVVVMDGDGEDDPNDIPRLLDALNDDDNTPIVFAERTRRSENATFQIGYHTYRHVHHLLTGIPVRYGNFSAARRDAVRKLVCADELWNHYCACVLKLRMPYRAVPTARAKRLAGESKMNLTSLVTHGLSAMSIFGDRIGVRLLITTVMAGGLAFLLLAGVLATRAFTDNDLPGWATFAAGLIVLLILQLGLSSLIFVFITLAGRSQGGFIPMRDHGYYVDGIRTIAGNAD